MSDRPLPTDPTLAPLLKERQFLAAVLVGLPGLAYAYAEAFTALFQGEAYNATGAAIALAANPITLYLAARQYPRGKAAEAVGAALAPAPGPLSPDAPNITAEDLAEAGAPDTDGPTQGEGGA